MVANQRGTPRYCCWATVLTRQVADLFCTIANGHHLTQAGFLHLEWPVEYHHNCLLFLGPKCVDALHAIDSFH
jgi:hypothetical protein